MWPLSLPIWGREEKTDQEASSTLALTQKKQPLRNTAACDNKLSSKQRETLCNASSPSGNAAPVATNHAHRGLLSAEAQTSFTALGAPTGGARAGWGKDRARENTTQLPVLKVMSSTLNDYEFSVDAFRDLIDTLFHLQQQLFTQTAVVTGPSSIELHLIELIRRIAEQLIYGDSHHDDRLFAVFCEKGVTRLWGRFFTHAEYTSDFLKAQIFQTLCLLIHNLEEPTSLFFLFSNNHMNNLISSAHFMDFALSPECYKFIDNHRKTKVLACKDSTSLKFLTKRMHEVSESDIESNFLRRDGYSSEGPPCLVSGCNERRLIMLRGYRSHPAHKKLATLPSSYLTSTVSCTPRATAPGSSTQGAKIFSSSSDRDAVRLLGNTSLPFCWNNSDSSADIQLREDLVSWYVSFLKSLALRFNKDTARLFYNERSADFPLYSEAARFIGHKDAMVRTHVRSVTLLIFRVPDAAVRQFVVQRSSFFTHLGCYWRETWVAVARAWKTLGKGYESGKGKDSETVNGKNGRYRQSQSIETVLLDALGEQEDFLLYLQDILRLDIPVISKILLERMFKLCILPILFGSLLVKTPSDNASLSSEQSQTSKSNSTEDILRMVPVGADCAENLSSATTPTTQISRFEKGSSSRVSTSSIALTTLCEEFESKDQEVDSQRFHTSTPSEVHCHHIPPLLALFFICTLLQHLQTPSCLKTLLGFLLLAPAVPHWVIVLLESVPPEDPLTYQLLYSRDTLSPTLRGNAFSEVKHGANACHDGCRTSSLFSGMHRTVSVTSSIDLNDAEISGGLYGRDLVQTLKRETAARQFLKHLLTHLLHVKKKEKAMLTDVTIRMEESGKDTSVTTLFEREMSISEGTRISFRSDSDQNENGPLSIKMCAKSEKNRAETQYLKTLHLNPLPQHLTLLSKDGIFYELLLYTALSLLLREPEVATEAKGCLSNEVLQQTLKHTSFLSWIGALPLEQSFGLNEQESLEEFLFSDNEQTFSSVLRYFYKEFVQPRSMLTAETGVSQKRFPTNVFQLLTDRIKDAATLPLIIIRALLWCTMAVLQLMVLRPIYQHVLEAKQSPERVNRSYKRVNNFIQELDQILHAAQKDCSEEFLRLLPSCRLTSPETLVLFHEEWRIHKLPVPSPETVTLTSEFIRHCQIFRDSVGALPPYGSVSLLCGVACVCDITDKKQREQFTTDASYEKSYDRLAPNILTWVPVERLCRREVLKHHLQALLALRRTRIILQDVKNYFSSSFRVFLDPHGFPHLSSPDDIQTLLRGYWSSSISVFKMLQVRLAVASVESCPLHIDWFGREIPCKNDTSLNAVFQNPGLNAHYSFSNNLNPETDAVIIPESSCRLAIDPPDLWYTLRELSVDGRLPILNLKKSLMALSDYSITEEPESECGYPKVNLSLLKCRIRILSPTLPPAKHQQPVALNGGFRSWLPFFAAVDHQGRVDTEEVQTKSPETARPSEAASRTLTPSFFTLTSSYESVERFVAIDSELLLFLVPHETEQYCAVVRELLPVHRILFCSNSCSNRRALHIDFIADGIPSNMPAQFLLFLGHLPTFCDGYETVVERIISRRLGSLQPHGERNDLDTLIGGTSQSRNLRIAGTSKDKEVAFSPQSCTTYPTMVPDEASPPIEGLKLYRLTLAFTSETRAYGVQKQIQEAFKKSSSRLLDRLVWFVRDGCP